MIAPHRDGFPIHLNELELPRTRLNPEDIYSFNNHHRFWTRSRMARTGITQVMRDLEDHQIITPKDVHKAYHDRYDPPPLPSLEDMMQRLDDAYHGGELLRYGSAREPQYTVFTESIWKIIKQEYDHERTAA